MFASCDFYGQIADTIRLKEIKIVSTTKKTKYLKTNGGLSSISGNPIKGILSKTDNIPEGTLASVKFYFNKSSIWFLKDGAKVEYRDIELLLLIYNVKDDGTPGKSIVESAIKFTVFAKNNESIALDLKPLRLNTFKAIFFGIEVIKKQAGNDYKIMT